MPSVSQEFINFSHYLCNRYPDFLKDTSYGNEYRRFRIAITEDGVYVHVETDKTQDITLEKLINMGYCGISEGFSKVDFNHFQAWIALQSYENCDTAYIKDGKVFTLYKKYILDASRYEVDTVSPYSFHDFQIGILNVEDHTVDEYFRFPYILCSKKYYIHPEYLSLSRWANFTSFEVLSKRTLDYYEKHKSLYEITCNGGDHFFTYKNHGRITDIRSLITKTKNYYVSLDELEKEQSKIQSKIDNMTEAYLK